MFDDKWIRHHMRLAHKSILAYALSLASFLSLHTFLLGQGVRSTIVGLRPYPGPMLIVPVEINGHGPFDFVWILVQQ